MSSDQTISATAMKQWLGFTSEVKQIYSDLFDGVGPIVGARAPGRVDLMGGVVDYSGGVVLERTIAEAVCVAVQKNDRSVLKLHSVNVGGENQQPTVELPLTAIYDASGTRSFSEASASFREKESARWCAYAGGCLYVLQAYGWLEPEQLCGVNFFIDGTVPVASGVSSSAALEVAAMTALCRLFEIQTDGLEIARLCQIVENRIVGAPCGIMDQVTASLGREEHLVVLKCQPHDVIGHQAIPSGWRFVAIDSHVKHSVGGRNYARARAASFMGLKILQLESHQDWNGYLGNLPYDAWPEWRDRLPEALSGERYSDLYGALPDPAGTVVVPEEMYRVRAVVEHHLQENGRVREFLALMQLANTEPDKQLMTEAGKLMLEAHSSYSERVDLGAHETDLLVNTAMELGPEHGIFGAKITGGGSGGAVVFLCSGDKADNAIELVRRKYEQTTSIYPVLMRGSSPGADPFGPRIILENSKEGS